ncbi:hypothetical protein SAMN05216553_11955 [Lentzea fradiae]|uniref:Uncharacterized protein n=1 Tax=Lentzea fradiae TaxID=200378 RepID=A0A1G8BGI7_9PSEU|nr:DUF5980 family protein [Lentzea fradiae]SDH32241.1 hypothetical protein SAMN05216553_11955 [Lentzea fradiae]
MKVRTTRSVLALAAVFLLAFAGTPAVAAAQTWQLEQFTRTSRMCVQQGDRNHGSYFIYIVTGTWSTDLKVGMLGLPPGWTATEYSLPPGENHKDPDGSVMVNGFIGVQGPASVELGTYYAYIWVTDGVVLEKLPTDIIVTTDDWVTCMNKS